VQRLTEPGADLNGNGITDIAEVIRTSRWSALWFSSDATVSLFTHFDAGTDNGGTNFSAGLSRACETLAASSQPNRTVVFLSEGDANRGSDVSTVLPCGQPATVYSIAVGANSTCAADPSGLGSLQEMADLTGGTCTEVVEPGDLPDILPGLIEPEIYRLGLSVNGGPEIDISADTSVPLPVAGPATVDWLTTVQGLAGPEDELCVTAYARLNSELSDATECVTVISNQPPACDSAAASHGVLWPPNHQLVEIEVLGIPDPDGDPVTIGIDSIHQDEPVNGKGDGNTVGDGFGVGTDTATLRAERSGRGNGRVYHVGFTADDGHGGSCSGEVLVGVPKNQGKKGKPAKDDGALYDSTLP
jgi:hypothetical protein